MRREREMEGRRNEEFCDVEATVPPPQLDLYEPLLEKEEEAKASQPNGNGNGHHVAMIGTKVSPIESLDFE